MSVLYRVDWRALWSTLADTATVDAYERAHWLAANTAAPARLAGMLTAVNDARPGTVRAALEAHGLDTSDAVVVAEWLAFTCWSLERGLWAAAGRPIDVPVPPAPAEPWPGLPDTPEACIAVLAAVSA